MQKDSRILISGAGVAGLTSAIWLGRHGFKPVVVEKSADVRADGYIISLSHASYRYAKRLDILSQLRERDTQIRVSSYHHKSGKAMLTLDYERLFEGVDIVQIMRDDLQAVLYDQAKNVAEFKFASSIKSIKQQNEEAVVTFEDGSVDTFDVVIGADGLHSVTRSTIFTESEVKKIYFGLFSSAYRLKNTINLSNRFENHMEQSRYMCVYTTRGEDLACVFIWQDDATVAPPMELRQKLLMERYAGAPTLVQQVLAEFPQNQQVYMDPLMQIEMQSWHKDNVVLLGDAAHCLTLLSGQGASSAFWGASALANALIETDKKTAFARYEAELRPVINQIQPATQTAAKWYVPKTTTKYWVRDAAMTYLPNAFFQAYFKRKYTRA